MNFMMKLFLDFVRCNFLQLQLLNGGLNIDQLPADSGTVAYIIHNALTSHLPKTGLLLSYCGTVIIAGHTLLL